jgi:hypothetical protein
MDQGDGKQRPWGIPTVRDRVVQMAAKIMIEPIFEADFEASRGWGNYFGTGAAERKFNQLDTYVYQRLAGWMGGAVGSSRVDWRSGLTIVLSEWVCIGCEGP